MTFEMSMVVGGCILIGAPLIAFILMPLILWRERHKRKWWGGGPHLSDVPMPKPDVLNCVCARWH